MLEVEFDLKAGPFQRVLVAIPGLRYCRSLVWVGSWSAPFVLVKSQRAWGVPARTFGTRYFDVIKHLFQVTYNVFQYEKKICIYLHKAGAESQLLR